MKISRRSNWISRNFSFADLTIPGALSIPITRSQCFDIIGTYLLFKSYIFTISNFGVSSGCSAMFWPLDKLKWFNSKGHYYCDVSKRENDFYTPKDCSSRSTKLSISDSYCLLSMIEISLIPYKILFFLIQYFHILPVQFYITK